MTEKFDDGGPAFPQTRDSWVAGGVPEGMYLWDLYFAFCMCGLLSSERCDYGYGDDVTRAEQAANIATTMIVERRKRMKG